MGELQNLQEQLQRLDLLVVLGYMPMDAQKANLFFQLVSHRYERGSIIVTTNKPFDQWGQVFGSDDVIAAAILDRLLHHSHVIATRGPSYRMKDRAARVHPEEQSGMLDDVLSDTLSHDKGRPKQKAEVR